MGGLAVRHEPQQYPIPNMLGFALLTTSLRQEHFP